MCGFRVRQGGPFLSRPVSNHCSVFTAKAPDIETGSGNIARVFLCAGARRFKYGVRQNVFLVSNGAVSCRGSRSRRTSCFKAAPPARSVPLFFFLTLVQFKHPPLPFRSRRESEAKSLYCTFPSSRRSKALFVLVFACIVYYCSVLP